MATVTSSGAESPTYLERFALTRAPFAAGVDDDFFCADSSLAQRLDMLQHLTVFGSQVLLVAGEAGIGKTTLLNQYLLRAGPNWRVCRVNADAMLTREALEQQLRGCYMPQSAGEPGVELETALAALHQSGNLALLVIDDAQEVSSTVLQQLVTLAAMTDDGASLLHILLCGEPELEARLAKLGAKAPEQVHVVHLAPFSELQTGAYLQHRLEVAGLQGDSPFTSTAVKNIYKASQGVPAAINERAHLLLLDIHSRTRSVHSGGADGSASGAGHRRWGLIGAAGVGALAIAAALFMRDGEQAPPAVTTDVAQATLPLALPEAVTPAPPAAAGTEGTASTTGDASPPGSPDNTALPELPPLPPAPPAPPAPVLTKPIAPGATPPSTRGEIQLSAQPPTAEFVPPIVAAPPSPPPRQVIEKTLVGTTTSPTDTPVSSVRPGATPGVVESEVKVVTPPDKAQTPMPLAATVDTLPGAQAESPVEPVSKAPVERAPAATDKPVPAVSAKPPVSKPAAAPVREKSTAQAAAKPAVHASTAASGGRGVAWLQSQRPGDYTLQLVGSRSESAVKRFIKTHGLGSQAAYFRTVHQGGDWFVLVYGAYPDRNAAQAGLGKLPAAVREGKPWPRSFASVQADMAKAR